MGTTLNNLALTMAGAAVCAIGSIASAQVEYDFILVRPFNTNPLAGECFVWGMNDNGVACGMATMDNQIGYPAFVWTEGAGKTRLPLSNPQAVNNHGLVVGNGSVYDLSTSQWITPPGLPGTYYGPSFAAVNDSGLAVGSISITSGSDSGGILRIPYLWDAVGGARTLEIPNAKSLYKLNNAGVALGWANNLVTQGPFVVDLESMAYTSISDLLPPGLGVGYPSAVDLNDSGEIVGAIGGTYPVYNYGWVYSPATGVRLLPFPGAGYQQSVIPTGINNSETIVGTISTTIASQHIFVYTQSTGLRDLNTSTGLIAGMPAGYRFYIPTDINNRGWIAGYGHTSAGQTTGFILKKRAPLCVADFNTDGGVDGDDTIAFFAAWDAGMIAADVTSDGGVDGDDVIAFFGAWDAGC